MGHRYFLGFILSVFLGFMLIPPLLAEPPIRLAKNCTSPACPLAKQLIKKVAPQLRNQAYTLYTANFSANDTIPLPIPNGTTPIIWLGGYRGIDMSRLTQYKIILTSTPLLRNVLRANQLNAYYLPLYSLPYKEQTSSDEKFIALINSPQKIEPLLQQKQIPYRRYTTNKPEEILKDMPHFKAAFVENTAFNEKSLDVHPIFFTLAENKIPLACYWGWPKVEENINMFNDTINFYITDSEIDRILNGLEEKTNVLHQRKNDALELVNSTHTLSAAAARLKYILTNRKEPAPQTKANTLNIDLPTAVGHTTCGDYNLAKNLETALTKYNYHISYSFYNSLYKYPTETNILFRGSADDRFSKIGQNNIFYFAYPRFEGDDARTEFEENYYDNLLPLFKDYEAVATASESLANALKMRGINAYYIPQFTDTAKFFPQYTEALKSEVIFIGRYAPYRRAPQIVMKHNLPLTLYGPNWQGQAKAEAVDYNDLNQYYSSAKIVLNDSLSEMLLHGVISNRIFDATACETLVISDYMPEIEKIYGDTVPMWKTEQELVDLIKYYLAPEHEAERKDKAKRAREITLKNFTAEIAAQKFNNIITAIKQQKGL